MFGPHITDFGLVLSFLFINSPDIYAQRVFPLPSRVKRAVQTILRAAHHNSNNPRRTKIVNDSCITIYNSLDSPGIGGVIIHCRRDSL